MQLIDWKVKVKLGKPVTAYYGKLPAVTTLCRFQCGVVEKETTQLSRMVVAVRVRCVLQVLCRRTWTRGVCSSNRLIHWRPAENRAAKRLVKTPCRKRLGSSPATEPSFERYSTAVHRYWQLDLTNHRYIIHSSLFSICFCLMLVDVPFFRRSTVGGRAFPVAGAKVWNSLSSDVTNLPRRYLVLGTDWKHTYFATATKLSDYVWHSFGYHVPSEQWSLQ